MAKVRLNATETKQIDKAVAHFEAYRDRFEPFARSIVGHLRVHPVLSQHIHFIRYRLKELDSLRGKLERKALGRRADLAAKKKIVLAPITADNLFQRVNDLAGIRVVYLHTEQFREIHPAILAVFDEQRYRLLEKPTASCWDVEYEDFYKSLGIRTRLTRDSMYSSVHYIVEVNRKTKMSCELQVRTLTDEVWGEVSHRLNYPTPSPSPVCKSQLKTLARITTGCTRLVDGIFEMDREARKRAGE